jgi:hypothetical protein
VASWQLSWIPMPKWQLQAVIARSFIRVVIFADVTPFLADLPVLQMVEIGDAMMAYDDPFTFTTYLLVMQNALLIPSMDHNLVPPFLL